MTRPPPDLHQSWFGDTADPDLFCPTAAHASAAAELFAAIKTLAGFIVLTGEPGTGKTTVLRRVTRDVEATGGRVVWYGRSALTEAKLASLVRRVGASDAIDPEAQHETLPPRLRAEHRRQGDALMVAVDEAQGLQPSELDGLRALVESGAASGTRVTVVLAGQPPLDLRLEQLGREPGVPAYALRVVLPHLDSSEVGHYVAHRLRLAGIRRDDVFEPAAIDRIAGYAGGIPRVINQLCEAALRISEPSGVLVSAPIVDAAAEQLTLPFCGRGGVGAWSPKRTTPVAGRRPKRRLPLVRPGIAGASVALLLVAAVGFFVAERVLPFRFVSPPSPVRTALIPAEAPASSEVTPEETRVPAPPVMPATPEASRDTFARGSLHQAPQPVGRAGTVTEERPPPASQPAAPVMPATPEASRDTLAGGSLRRGPQPVARSGTVTEERPPPASQPAAPVMPATPEASRDTPAGRGPRQAPQPAGTPPGERPPGAATPSAPPVVRRASPMALALLDSSEAGNLAKVQASLAEGASPDSQDTTGMTALMVAVVHDRGAVAELLLARGANVNASDDGGVTALMLAANNGRTALLQRLINRGATVNARSAAGWTALTYAAWNGNVAAARRLLEAGANPALHDRIGWTALQYAAWRAADVSRTRLPDASDVLPTEDGGQVMAAEGRYREMVDLLRAAGRGR